MRGSCLVAAPGHPLAEKAMVREGFRYPWVDITYTEHEPYILHPRDQTTARISAGPVRIPSYGRYFIEPLKEAYR